MYIKLKPKLISSNNTNILLDITSVKSSVLFKNDDIINSSDDYELKDILLTDKNEKPIASSNANEKTLFRISTASINKLIEYYNKHNKLPEFIFTKIYDTLSDNIIYKLNPLDEIDIYITPILTWDQVNLLLSQFIAEECPQYSSKGNAGIYINKWIKENL